MRTQVLILFCVNAFSWTYHVNAQSPPPSTPPSADPANTPVDDSQPTCSQPTINNMSIYRKNIKTGIMIASGAEIKFPGVSAPDMRTVLPQDNHVILTDITADGTPSESLWDVSALDFIVARSRSLW